MSLKKHFEKRIALFTASLVSAAVPNAIAQTRRADRNASTGRIEQVFAFQIQRGTKIVGAIGVSGGTVPQDIEVAEAGVAAFENAG